MAKPSVPRPIPYLFIAKYLSDSSNILSPVFFAETQVLVQSKSNIVPVKSVGGQSQVQEVLLQGNCDSGLTAGREAGEPQREALLATKGAALLVRDGRRMPCYVADEGQSVSVDLGGRFRGEVAAHTYVAIMIHTKHTGRKEICLDSSCVQKEVASILEIEEMITL